MASPSDLTTLAAVKSWASVTSTNDDAVLGALISQMSRRILTYLGRGPILPATIIEVRDGDDFGRSEITLRRWPVVSVSSVSVDGTLVPKSGNPGSSSGWVLEQASPEPPGRPTRLILRGAPAGRLSQGTEVTYTSGYQITESFTVPVSPIAAVQPYGLWMVDAGVVYASGTALVPVAANPSAGQYAVSAGVYTFAVGDVGAAVTISYGYVPFDLANACIELVASRYAYRKRIGEHSKSLGGQETTSYESNSMPEHVREVLQPYRSVFTP